MSHGIFTPPPSQNEPIRSYAPGSAERHELQQALASARSQQADIPMYIGGQEVRTGKLTRLAPPHNHAHTLGAFHQGDGTHVQQAIDAALAAKAGWAAMPWVQRVSIFLKAAQLIAGPYRYRLNAATMLGQSKNAFQAEIDAACETIDFLRFNARFAAEIYGLQPVSMAEVWNRMEYRPLEGFTLAITPFNFTAIGVNLPTSMALMGNTVVWKPAATQAYSAHVAMQILREAGLPDGVINLVHADGDATGKAAFSHPDFAGVHFTGSTGVFQTIWKTIGGNIATYRSYPRIVGETGGKDFIVAHASADPQALCTAIIRGAFEYQGQKCSAASRCYIPSNLWPLLKEQLIATVNELKMGPVEDFRNFVNAVIDERSFDRIVDYIEQARKNPMNTILAGGSYDKREGYFIRPTLIETRDPRSTTMCEEIFGPVLTIYVYPADQFEETLALVDSTSPYALTGAVFAQNRSAIARACERLENAAGNFYINDKPTGAVVGQQPFGGARGSGTNDKAGDRINLLRWTSLRTIKETFVPPTDYRYPFMNPEIS